MRPYGAEIFEACREGDLSTVRRLFDSGQASPLYVTPRGKTMLEVCQGLCHSVLRTHVAQVATSNWIYCPTKVVELVTYLSQAAEHPDGNDIAELALSGLHRQMHNYCTRPAHFTACGCLDKLVNLFGLDVEACMEQTRSNTFICWAFGHPGCSFYEHSRETLSVSWEELYSLPKRYKLLVELRTGRPVDSATALRTLGLNEWTPKSMELEHYGTTVLHLAAANSNLICGDQGWERHIVAFLCQASCICAPNHEGRHPSSCTSLRMEHMGDSGEPGAM